MAIIARALHLSDLHLVEDITERGKRLFRKQFLTKTHAFEKIVGLHSKLRKLEKYDLVIITGDITTDGAYTSLQTARKFIEENEIRDSINRIITRGLGAAADKRLILPGNHDRFRGKWIQKQRPNRQLEEIFDISQTYPYVVGYRCGPGCALIFFVFDSTPPAFIKGWSWSRRIARGHLSFAECDRILDGAKNICSLKRVRDLSGEEIEIDPVNTIRIVLLHHHPMVDDETYPNKLTLMENSGYFVDCCRRAGINLVLFGHEHKKYNLKIEPATGYLTPFGPPNDLNLLCCPSTLGFDEAEAGFYWIEFNRDGGSTTIGVTLHEWNGKDFGREYPLVPPIAV
jgi:predicted phosphodiesterase